MASSGWEPTSTAPLNEPVMIVWFYQDKPSGSAEDVGIREEDCWVFADTGDEMPRPDGWRPLGGES
jgi:hypothetical protein